MLKIQSWRCERKSGLENLIIRSLVMLLRQLSVWNKHQMLGKKLGFILQHRFMISTQSKRYYVILVVL